MLKTPMSTTDWPAVVRLTPFSWDRYTPKKEVKIFWDQPELKARKVTSQIMGFL